MMTLIAMPDLASPEIWMSFLTLTFLEIVLGVDNIIFISIASAKLNRDDQKKATNIGLILAMVLRIALLFGISWLIAMEASWISIDWFGIHGEFSGQSLILIAGGLFLLYKSVTEIHHKLESDAQVASGGEKKASTLSNAIIEITLINIVFSFDSILTAVGMTNGLEGALMIMIAAVILSVVIMMAFAVPVGRFVSKHPTIQMLGLSFLILIGFMLIAEGAHIAHFTVADQSIGSIPKGYLYFAIAFSLGVEFLNIRLRKRNNPIQLHGIQEEAIRDGIIEP